MHIETPKILGGTALSPIKLARPSPFGTEEKEAVIKVLKKGILSKAGKGPNVKLFEKKFAQFFRVKYTISTTSGTTALHAALAALGIKAGDEVLVPALSFVSSASVILQQGATPVFVDIDRHTFCMDPADIKKKITSKAKALIVVHLYGRPAAMDEILKISRQYKLKVVEDCAQAHGAVYDGKLLGTLGDFGCFSFYQTKNISCGEGGMVITNNKELYKNCTSVVDHGLVENNLERYDYDRLGYNYHLTELQAALGIVQLKKLKGNNKKRQNNANLYQSLLREGGIQFQSLPKKGTHVYYSLTALLPAAYRGKVDWFIQAVREEGVEINRIYPIPLNKTKLFNQYYLPCPVSEDIAMRLFNFYTNPGISKSYIQTTALAVKKILNFMEVHL